NAKIDAAACALKLSDEEKGRAGALKLKPRAGTWPAVLGWVGRLPQRSRRAPEAQPRCCIWLSAKSRRIAKGVDLPAKDRAGRWITQLHLVRAEVTKILAELEAVMVRTFRPDRAPFLDREAAARLLGISSKSLYRSDLPTVPGLSLSGGGRVS